jgi:hypothetical protein
MRDTRVPAAGRENVVALMADGTHGLAAHAPYDAIVVAAAPTVSPALAEQLRDGGRLVLPMGPGGDEIVTKFRKRGGQVVREADAMAARFVPLVGGPGGTRPDFNVLVSAIPAGAGPRPGRRHRPSACADGRGARGSADAAAWHARRQGDDGLAGADAAAAGAVRAAAGRVPRHRRVDARQPVGARPIPAPKPDGAPTP